jgi:hypothetical protein
VHASYPTLLPYTCIFLAHSSGPHKCPRAQPLLSVVVLPNRPMRQKYDMPTTDMHKRRTHFSIQQGFSCSDGRGPCLSLVRLTTRMRQKHDMTTTDMNCTQTTLINRELQQFVRDEQRPHGLRGTSGIYSPTLMGTSYFSRARLLPYTCIFLAHSSQSLCCQIVQ